MSLALIAGTGFDQFGALENQKHHDVSTAWGEPSDVIIEGQIGNKNVFFLQRHGSKFQYPPNKINYRANIAALHKVGASSIIATAAVGGIDVETGKIVIPDQIIDYTYGRENTFYDDGDEVRYIDFTEPYHEGLRKKLIDAARSARLTIETSGTYGATQGPRLETAAEIKRLKKDGCTIVGMTGMPEACLARELSIPYATIALVVNPAAGLGTSKILISDIENTLEKNSPLFFEIFSRACEQIT